MFGEKVESSAGRSRLSLSAKRSLLPVSADSTAGPFAYALLTKHGLTQSRANFDNLAEFLQICVPPRPLWAVGNLELTLVEIRLDRLNPALAESVFHNAQSDRGAALHPVPAGAPHPPRHESLTNHAQLNLPVSLDDEARPPPPLEPRSIATAA